MRKHNNSNQEVINQKFFYACNEGILENVRYFLTSSELEEHADIHANNDEGFRWACNTGYVDIIKFLIELDRFN